MTALIAATLLFAQGTGTTSDPYLLPPVVITATRLWQSSQLSAWPIEVIEATVDEACDLATTMDKSTADVRSYGYEGQPAYGFLGGIAAARVLILDNGIPLNTRRDGVIDLSLIPLAACDRVEIVKGPLSALYGSSAIGGVVNVIRSSDDILTAILSMTDQAGINTGLRASRNFGVFGITASGGYISNPGFRHNDNVVRYNGRGSIRVSPLSNLSVELSAGYTHRKLGMPGDAPDTTDSLFIPPPFGDSIVTSTYDYEIDDLFTANLKADYLIGDNISTSLNLYTANQTFAYDWKYQGYYPDWTSYTTQENDSYKDTKLGGDLQLTAGIGDMVVLTGGVSTIFESLDGTKLANDSITDTVVLNKTWDAADNQLGVWLEAIGTFGFLTPMIAIRIDNSQQYGMFASPEAGVSVSAIPDVLKVSLAYGQAFHAPTFNDLYWPEDLYGIGDSTLVPERGQSAALSVDLRALHFLTFSVSGSWKEIKDMISWIPDPEDPSGLRWKPANLNKVNILSGDFSAGWRIAEGLLSGSIGLVYNDANETVDILDTVTYDADFNAVYVYRTIERQAAFIPPLTVKGNLAVRAWPGGKVAANIAWTGQRINYYTDWANYPKFGVLEKEIAPSMKMDLSVSQKFLKLVTVELGVKNVLGDQTPSHFGSYASLDYPTAPRRLYGALSVSYR
ncbi:TonB-dependent receptor [candidate division WOR-3 bacterium]|nr:TonB-dependent receptor [candidate division WOR-3 bacterium]